MQHILLHSSHQTLARDRTHSYLCCNKERKRKQSCKERTSKIRARRALARKLSGFVVVQSKDKSRIGRFWCVDDVVQRSFDENNCFLGRSQEILYQSFKKGACLCRVRPGSLENDELWRQESWYDLYEMKHLSSRMHYISGFYLHLLDTSSILKSKYPSAARPRDCI